MAKVKTGTGAVVLRAQITQGAANAFAQASLLTGLSSTGNDALIISEIQVEFPDTLNAAAGLVTSEFALSRASKAAMPTIFDDDVLFKFKQSEILGAAASTYENPGVFIYVPPQEIVLIEDTVFAMVKSLNNNAAYTFNLRITAQPATVTESEKVGILLTRIN